MTDLLYARGFSIAGRWVRTYYEAVAANILGSR